jgi:ABC-type branched-subunit amino acid transport system substrate-binding protein
MKIPQQEIENQIDIERRKPEYDRINFYDDGANGAFDDGFEHGFKAAIEWIGLEIDIEEKEEESAPTSNVFQVIGDAYAAGLPSDSRILH